MPLSTPGPRPVTSLHALTGARFVAAAAVVFGHIAMMHDLLGPWARGNGANAVAFFFVLSGFILTYNYADRLPRGDKRAYFGFVQARFARIYPVYLLVLLAVTAMSLTITHYRPGLAPDVTPARLAAGWLANLFMVQAYSWNMTTLWYWCAPAWSLSAEATFYLMFPLILWQIRRLQRPRAIVAAMAGAWLATAALIAALFLVAVGLMHRPAGSAELVEYCAPYLRIGDFVVGCLAGLWFVRRGTDPWPSRLGREAALWGGLAVMVTVGTLNNAAAIPHSVGMSLPFVPAAVLIVLALASGPTSVSRLLTSRPMIHLGEASYSLYLVHWLAMVPIMKLTDRPQPLWSCVAFAGSVAASLVLYRWVEEPCRKLLRKPVRVPELPTLPNLGLTTAAA